MLEKLKAEVLALGIRCEKGGLCLHKSGNFSLRDPESGLIAITTSGLDRMTAGAEDICLLDPDGGIVEIGEGEKPTSEALLHLRAYWLRRDVFCVAHTHSHYATTMAILRREIPNIVSEATVYGGKVPLAPYGAPGTRALADSIDDIIPSHDVCLLAGHGLLAVGADTGSVWLKALYAEEVARLYHSVLVAGGGKEPPTIPPENTLGFSR